MIMLCQAASYALLTLNFRSIAAGHVAVALMTDGCNASLAFFILRRIIKADDSTPQFIGYLAGSLLGTTIGMYI